MTALLLADIVIGIIAVLMGLRIIRHAKRALMLRSEGFSRLKHNSNLEAANLATSLVKEAEEEIEIYDDGDFFEESTYNYDPFIEAIQDKLKKNPSFRIRCYFNVASQDLKFIQRFKGHNQVSIYRRNEERPDDLHYKAIDGWIKGVLSAHHLGDGERGYRDFSYKNFPPDDIPRAKGAIIGKFRQPPTQFEEL